MGVMGVIEHLPNYALVLQKFMALLKPARRIFLDASACTKKYELSSYMVKYIYGGNHSFLMLHDFLDKLAKTRLSCSRFSATERATSSPFCNGRAISSGAPLTSS